MLRPPGRDGWHEISLAHFLDHVLHAMPEIRCRRLEERAQLTPAQRRYVRPVHPVRRPHAHAVVKGETQDMLMTHRNLNFAATVAATSMALWRAQHKRPNAVYLGAGIAGVGVLAYTAYLGGKLVYDAFTSSPAMSPVTAEASAPTAAIPMAF